MLLFPIYPFSLCKFVPNQFTIAVSQHIVTEISHMLTHKLSDCFRGGNYGEALGLILLSSAVRLHYYMEVNTLRGFSLHTLTYRTSKNEILFTHKLKLYM